MQLLCISLFPAGHCTGLWIVLEPLSAATSMNGKWKDILKLAGTWAKGT